MEQKSFIGTDTEPVIAPSSDEKTMALLSHILTLVIPIVAPLIIYLIKKDESTFIASHAKESLNFQITVAIIMIGLFITIIGIALMPFVGIAILILVIIATIRASEGKLYKYPVALRLIK